MFLSRFETRFEHRLKMQGANNPNVNNQPQVDPYAGCRDPCHHEHNRGVCPGTVQIILRTDTACHQGICGDENQCACKYTCLTPCGGQCPCAQRY